MIAGVHFVRNCRPGKPLRWYVYAWRGGPCVLKIESPTKPKLGQAELAALSQALDSARQVRADTIAGALREWRGNPGDPRSPSPEWARLAPTTKLVWGLELDRIEDKWGKLPLAVWNDPRMVAKVVAWRDSRSATPRAADMGVTVLSRLLEWCRLRARVKVNVADRIPAIYGGADRAEIIWTDDDLLKAKAAAIAANRPRVYDAICLATLTGMRRSDLCAVTLDEVGDHAIVRTARKKSRGRRRRAVVPLMPETVQLIDELRALPRGEGVRTLLVNSLGRAWTPGSLGAAVNQIVAAAVIVHPGNVELGTLDRTKHLHDCRGTFVTKLCRAGLSDQEIAGIVAWSVDSVATIRKTYVDDAAIVVALSHRIRQAL